MGEKSGHLSEELFEEVKGLLLSRVQVLLLDSPSGLNVHRFPRTPQMRVGGDHGGGVPGYVDFRNHGDAPRMRVGHHFANLLLGVETAIAGVWRPAPGTHLSEEREGF